MPRNPPLLADRPAIRRPPRLGATPFAHSLLLAALLWTVSSASLTAQPDAAALDKVLYEAALLEVAALQSNASTADSLTAALVADAEAFAAANDWASALTMLDLVIACLKPQLPAPTATISDSIGSAATNRDFATDAAPSSVLPAPATYLRPFQVEVGIDYSQQEFETTFLETDSILVDELQNPYLAVNYLHGLPGEGTVLLRHRMRYDAELFNYGLRLTWENTSPQHIQRFDLDGGVYATSYAGQSNYFDGRIGYYVGNDPGARHRWYVDARLRNKRHATVDEVNRDILSGWVTTGYAFRIDRRQTFEIHISPQIYREQVTGGYKYLQGRLGADYRYREGISRYLELGADVVGQDFENRFDEVLVENRFTGFLPRLVGEWPIAAASWAVTGRIEGEWRRYERADAVNPDLAYLTMEWGSRLHLSSLQSLGLAYAFERGRHASDDPLDQPFAEQADFTAHGLVLSGDLYSAGGLFLNATYRFTLRDYPNAVDSPLNSFYADRRIHSLSLLGWIPLTRSLTLQLVANYDNDQDRDFDRNDSRSTLVNAGLVYGF